MSEISEDIESGNYMDVARAALKDASTTADRMQKTEDPAKYAMARAAVGQLAAQMAIVVVLSERLEEVTNQLRIS